MNRTLTNVLFGGIGSSATQSDYKIEGQITKTSVDETVEALNNADNVILVCIVCSSNLFQKAKTILRLWVTAWLLLKRSMLLQKSSVCCVLRASMYASPFILLPEGTSLCFHFFRCLTVTPECLDNATYCSLRLLCHMTVSSIFANPMLQPHPCDSCARNGRD